TTNRGNLKKSGHFETVIGGHFPPLWVATLNRHDWPLWAAIRSEAQVPIDRIRFLLVFVKK
ncbi:hypothetical protein KJ708_12175, partial [bacterium]|nr:hypothetical protein [bacterium]